MSFTVDRIDHVEVFVRDIEASVIWYARVLGLREVGRWNPEPVMIGVGDTKLALFRATDEGEKVENPQIDSSLHWHLVAWRTDAAGFDSAQAHLKACGISFEGPIDHGTAMSIYFDDLDGHPLEITADKP